ncbi:XRE family transcriptional regulator [Catellatospora methionotrophica]|uniref:XRE family transcriptional regulator n=1 Tax=Catellatospora methionotrophica TaxID=121620 RepID=UPI001EF221AA|nr:XRE family transcriptional regulator [Catellatospora methionotrophica]
MLHHGGGDTVTLDLSSPAGRTIRVKLPRRDFHGLLAAGALRTMLPDGICSDVTERVHGAIGNPRRTDLPVLDYFRTLLAQHYMADKVLGPRHLVEVVRAQIAVLDKLRYGSKPGTAEPAMRLLAQYAEFAGWLYQDLGDVTAAKYWTDRAAQRAQAVGDHQLAAYLLVRRSNIALLDDDAVDVIELAAAARRMAGPISPKLAALATQQEARGWALRAEPDRFRRLIDSAADLLLDHSDEVDDDAPVYLHSYDMDTLEEQSASGYRSCGQADTAIAILERRVAAVPADHHRDRAHQLAKLANAVLQTAQPDPERAAEIGLSCVDAVRSTGSARINGELLVLDQTLRQRWPGLRGTGELHEALSVA